MPDVYSMNQPGMPPEGTPPAAAPQPVPPVSPQTPVAPVPKSPIFKIIGWLVVAVFIVGGAVYGYKYFNKGSSGTSGGAGTSSAVTTDVAGQENVDEEDKSEDTNPGAGDSQSGTQTAVAGSEDPNLVQWANEEKYDYASVRFLADEIPADTILFDGSGEISKLGEKWVNIIKAYNPNTGELTNVLETTPRTHIVYFDVSPDGNKIVFTQRFTYRRLKVMDYIYGVFVVDLKNKTLTRLFEDLQYLKIFSIKWSPTGEYFVMYGQNDTKSEDIIETHKKNRIYMARTDGSNLHMIKDPSAVDDSFSMSPFWSFDGESVLYTYTNDQLKDFVVKYDLEPQQFTAIDIDDSAIGSHGIALDNARFVFSTKDRQFCEGKTFVKVVTLADNNVVPHCALSYAISAIVDFDAKNDKIVYLARTGEEAENKSLIIFDLKTDSKKEISLSEYIQEINSSSPIVWFKPSASQPKVKRIQ